MYGFPSVPVTARILAFFINLFQVSLELCGLPLHERSNPTSRLNGLPDSPAHLARLANSRPVREIASHASTMSIRSNIPRTEAAF